MEKTEIITIENVNTENQVNTNYNDDCKTDEIIRPIIKDGIVNLESENKIITNCVVNPTNGNINGITTDNVKALYRYDMNKWFFGSDICKLNLVSLKDRTLSERREIVSKAHQKARENREREKDFNNLAKSMLNVALSENQAKKLLNVEELPNFVDMDNLNVGAIMIAKGIQECLENGSFKWFESIRDTAGYKPKNEVELQADIMTESDRQLLENVSQRIG